MRPDLEKCLFDKYPDIFDKSMFSGFECGDGWFNLVDVLCNQLYLLPEIPHAVQVKEKFGGLRFYIFNGSDKVFTIIDFAEAMSLKICEECGCPGTKRSDGWIRTLCEKCYKQ